MKRLSREERIGASILAAVTILVIGISFLVRSRPKDHASDIPAIVVLQEEKATQEQEKKSRVGEQGDNANIGEQEESVRGAYSSHSRIKLDKSDTSQENNGTKKGVNSDKKSKQAKKSKQSNKTKQSKSGAQSAPARDFLRDTIPLRK